MKKYHFIGIGGIGMSGLARLLLDKQCIVSGSDLASSKITEALAQAGATVHVGQSAEHIHSAMTVVYTTGIKLDNPEYAAALALKCPMLHRSQVLHQLMQERCALAVAGTHGKTTTSSLLTWVLESSGQSPSYAIGGVIPQLKSNAGSGSGVHFVAEACESDGTFLNYLPYGAIVTNIDLDHMDHYRTEEALVDAFGRFMGNVTSEKHLFWCGDDKYLRTMNPKGISYGFSKGCQLHITRVARSGWSMHFDVTFQGKLYKDIEVSLTGRHNALNASAVFGLALQLGIDEQAIRQGLRTFKGVLRRCEKKGESHGILFLDDYGHHPTEIRATLQGIRQAIGERRLVVLYQPHRYSRAKECVGLYEGVFNDADEVFITEIYAALETPIPGVSHESVIAETHASGQPNCHHLLRHHLAKSIVKFLRPHDVVVTLGAGDITKAAGEILDEMIRQAPPKLKVGVISGGASVEHEVSLMSVKHILASLHADYYDIESFHITREGVWKCQGCSGSKAKISKEVLEKILGCDILFPVLHGTYGEDGTIQGFFEILSKAYVGCDYRSSAISMDKAVTKQLLLHAGLPTSPFVTFSRHQWDMNVLEWHCKINEHLHYPVFVKPTHLGSSVGVHKVMTEQELDAAVADAFRYDTHVLVENGIVGREIEFSVLGNDDPVVFPPGEILTGGAVYDYTGKYSANGMPTIARAELPAHLIEEGMKLVKGAYEATNCMGMARIDTFLDRGGKFWLNEINPIPGFTQYSLYPQMCAVNGLEGKDLVDRLIILGLERRRTLDKLEKNIV